MSEETSPYYVEIINVALPLVILSPGDYFFACWPEENGVLKLCCVAALAIAERRIRFHNALLAQVFQSHQIPRRENGHVVTNAPH